MDQLTGSEDEDEDGADEEYEEDDEEYYDEDAEEDVFTEFVSIIDGFLGELPEADVIANQRNLKFTRQLHPIRMEQTTKMKRVLWCGRQVAR